MNSGRRSTDKPKLTTAETIGRLNEVALALKVEPLPLAWAIEYIEGRSDVLDLHGPKGAPICTFGACKRNAYLLVEDENIYRCVSHSWKDPDNEDMWAVQFAHQETAELYTRDHLTFFR